MKIAIAQINTTAGDINGNARKIIQWSRKAARGGARLAVFPAAALTGCPVWDLLTNRDFIKRSFQVLEHLSRRIDEPACLLGCADNGRYYAVLVHKRKIVAKTAVRHQQISGSGSQPSRTIGKPQSRIHRFIKNGQSFAEGGGQSCAESQGSLASADSLGTGSPAGGGADTLVPLRFKNSRAQITESEPEFLVNISASSYHMGAARKRFEKLRHLARKKHLPLIHCNMAGGNEELIFDGNSLAIDAGGNLLARGKSFEEDLTVVDFDSHPASTAWRDMPQLEELHLALTIGIRDYVRKCGFKRVVFGLSGGIDSAVVCSLATSALSPANVTGVFMPSQYTSSQSMRDARALASNLGISYVSIPISSIYNSYLKELRPSFTGKRNDTTEQNIQARVRGNILMALSNKYGWLVLSCGNKSESAMGYCTLYGDMCGGLAPLSDVLKTTVYELAGYINRKKTIIPQATIERAPTAELKANQKDSDDLPPYEKLDPIIRAYVEENKPPGNIIVPGFSRGMVSSVIDRINRSEYKRRQAPPGLKVTTKAFGIGRKMPMVSPSIPRRERDLLGRLRRRSGEKGEG